MFNCSVQGPGGGGVQEGEEELLHLTSITVSVGAVVRTLRQRGGEGMNRRGVGVWKEVCTVDGEDPRPDTHSHSQLSLSL